MLQAIIVFNLKENYWTKLEKIIKNLVWGPILAHFQAAKTCFQKSVSVSQPSLCTISDKTNDQILRKLGDRRTGERTNGPTDKSNFIGRCPTNVEHPISHDTTKVKTTSLALILTLSNFTFNKKHFLQIKGSATGSVHHPMQIYFWIINIFQTHHPYILNLDRHSEWTLSILQTFK